MVGKKKKKLQCSGTKDIDLLCGIIFQRSKGLYSAFEILSRRIIYRYFWCLQIQDCEAERSSIVAAVERMNPDPAEKLNPSSMLCS